MDIDIANNIIKITSGRISSIFNIIEYLPQKIFISARELSKLAGKIVSTKSIIGDIIHLKTEFIYRTIENRSSWYSTFNLAHQIEIIKEILFRKNNINKLTR